LVDAFLLHDGKFIAAETRKFVVLPKRWIVERTIAWRRTGNA
jgi:hypothetical protein